MVEERERSANDTEAEQTTRTQRRRSRDQGERSALRKACRWSFSGIEEAVETTIAPNSLADVHTPEQARTGTNRRRRSGSASERSRSSAADRLRDRSVVGKSASGDQDSVDGAVGYEPGVKTWKTSLQGKVSDRAGQHVLVGLQYRLQYCLHVMAAFLEQRSFWWHHLLANIQQWRYWLWPPQQTCLNRSSTESGPEHTRVLLRAGSGWSQSALGFPLSKTVRFDPGQIPTQHGWLQIPTISRILKNWLTILIFWAQHWLRDLEQHWRTLRTLRPLRVFTHVRVETLLSWSREKLVSPGFKPVVLGLASAQALGAVTYDISEWLARFLFEALVQTVMRVRVDSTTLVESIQFGGLLPRFSKASCGPYLTHASSPTERKILILDLDETLVHSSFKDSTGCDLTVEVDVDDVPTVFFVRKRPHLELFIRVVRQWYDLVIFTASLRRYADPLIDALDPTGSLFCARYFRDDCVRLPPFNFVKNLSVVSPHLGKVIIVDNSPASYAMHAANALPIDAWYDDPFDEELLNLLPVLRSLSVLEDVRSVLGLRLTRGSLISRYRPLVST
ncbi:hypothetical protein CCYA_CCYA04G1216 [Cyanidiococcus yangmingshanensis]|nr:hypothetical protein CCYA_CCYA04G1216 [Cyanidiococcus yangmingshanensis]